MIILGIDPGTATTGYGIIESQKAKGKRQIFLKCLGYGVIQTSSSLPMPRRLKLLDDGLSKLIKRYNPGVLVVENVYFFKNLKT